jgi:peptidyl-prolyl cis-trans isomerase C
MHVRAFILTSLTALLVVSCSRAAPAGDVVAKVGDREITSAQVSLEVAGTAGPNAQVTKSVQDRALQQIVDRTILAEAARKAGADRSEAFAGERQRVLDALTIEAWKAQIAAQTPAPTPEEVQAYIAAHPDTYARRKIYRVEQIRYGQPNNQALLKELEPVNSLSEAAQVLNARGVPFQTIPGDFDTLTAPPTMAEQIAKLQVGEVFIIPAGQMVMINEIKLVRTEPVTGEAAVRHASQVLKTQRVVESQRLQLQHALDEGKDGVVYTKAAAEDGN